MSAAPPVPVRWAAAAMFVGAFGLYAFTAAPDLALVDSAELALAAATGGVAHPPGVPLFLLVGRVFAGLPFAPTVRMLNLMSAFFAAGAAAAVMVATERTLAVPLRGARQGGGRRGGGPDDGLRPRLLAALVAGSAFATAYNPWVWSAVTEVYALNVFLFAGAWACAASAVMALREAGRGQEVPAAAWRRITGAAALAALGLANHHATALLAAPLLLLLLLGSRPALLRSSRLWILSGVCVAGSLSLYLYLFLAAKHDVALNWGRIDSFELLWRHVVGKQYQVQMGSTGEVARLAARSFWVTLVTGVGWIPAALVGVGLGATLRAGKGRRVLAATPVVVILLNLALSMTYVAGPEDRMAYDLPATVAWCVLAGVGAFAILTSRRLAASPARMMAVGGVGVAAVIALNAIDHFAECNLREERVARTFVEESLGRLPQGAVVLTGEWNLYAPYLWMRTVEGFRPDLRVIDVLMLRRFWYMEFLERTMPELLDGDEFRTFREQVTHFDLGRPFDGANMQAYYDAMIFDWIRRGDEAGGAFADASCWDHPQEVSWISRVPSVPEGLFLRLTRSPDPREVPPLVACDAENLAALRRRITPAALERNLDGLPERHHPYQRVWRVYQASVETSLLVGRRMGEAEFRQRVDAYSRWFPELDVAVKHALAMP